MSAAVEKVRKLLRLARGRGASQYEAESAMAAASKIMLEHGLTEEDVAERDERPCVGPWIYGANQNWVVILSSAVCTLHAVRTVLHIDGNQLAFIGRKTNVEIACEQLLYLVEQIQSIYEERTRMKVLRWSDFEKTFKEACAAKLINKAQEIFNANRLEIPPHQALVVIDQSLAMAAQIAKEAGAKEKELPRPVYGSGSGTGLMDAERIKFNKELRR